MADRPSTQPPARALSLSLVLALLLASACGGRSPRAPAPTPPPRPPAPVAPTPTPAFPSPAPAAGAEDLAPEPRIRIGLSTAAEVVRLTSSSTFRVGGAESWLEMQEVLVAPRRDGASGGGGAVRHRVQLASFPSRDQAASLRERMVAEIDEPIELVREEGSGRYALRVGSFSTKAGASALEGELRRRGHDSARTVVEALSRPRPTGLVLRGLGAREQEYGGDRIYAIPRSGGAWIEVDGRAYRGYVEIALNGSGLLTVVNVVGFEDYLRGVVPAELSPSVFPEREALKAQAVAARTYAVKRRGEFLAEGFDLCATAACQVYRGVGVEDELSDEAVRETAGEILTFEGEPIDALYTSTCGGRTENAENVFSTPAPYLVSRACFVESGHTPLRSRATGRLPLEVAVLVAIGVVEEGEALGRDLDAPPSSEEALRWTSAAMAHLGQRPCSDTATTVDGALDVVALARLLSRSLCWERRLPFLVSAADAERLVPDASLREEERRPLAHAIREGLVRPQPEGLSVGAPLSRREVLATLYRLVESRGGSPLREATVRAAEGARLVLRDESGGDEDDEIVTFVLPETRLYLGAPGGAYASFSVLLLPGDRVRFHSGDEGVNLLVLDSEGASFDRSSRFSHWLSRKTAEDLTDTVNLRHRVGEVKELRPRRYGRSGRIAELEIVGSERSEVVRGLSIRWALGVRENLFFLDAQRNDAGAPTGWVFTGRGWGHGVGLCQVGAYGMAAAGYDYRDILAHYYPGTALRNVDRAAPTP